VKALGEEAVGARFPGAMLVPNAFRGNPFFARKTRSLTNEGSG
jgi:hypothetical protein